MSHTRTQRHTKLAQYVIQPKNTVRSRHFAPRMRVSKGIKDSKASFARGAQNGQPRSSFFLYLSFSFSVLAILSPSPLSLSLYLHVALSFAPCSLVSLSLSLFLSSFAREAIENVLPRRGDSSTRGGRVLRLLRAAHTAKELEIRTNRCTMRGRGAG